MNVLSKRFWRNLARDLLWRALPESARRGVARRASGYRENGRRFRLTYARSGDGLSVDIEGRLRLRIQDRDRKRFDFQLVENGDCVDEARSFLDAVASKRVLFDVGSAEGLFSLLFCAAGGDRRAFAYEASPVMCAEARRLAGLNACAARTALHNVAVGEREGSGRFLRRASGYFCPVGTAPDGVEGRAEVVTLDSECRRLGLEPDIVKIDVEGYEWEVLQGGRKLWARRPLIFLELHLNALEERGIPPRDVLGLLTDHGYRFFEHQGAEVPARRLYDSLRSVRRFIAR
ncbi:MAG: FkbM family methyltransferase [Elusimicrobia bacterium]|nr:FkbM family methyltransferase [Elusimicrobiota bacterium]